MIEENTNLSSQFTAAESSFYSLLLLKYYKKEIYS